MPVISAAESVSAIVVDGGASSLRVGWAGEDVPRCVLPNEYGFHHDPAVRGATAGHPHLPAGEDAMMDVDPPAPRANGGEGGGATGGDASGPPAADRSQEFASQLYSEQRRRYIGDMGANTFRPGMEIGTSFGHDGLLASASSLLAQLEYGIDTFLDADATQHPLLFTEPTWNPKEAREELIEMAFEGLGVPGFYIANQPVMSSYVCALLAPTLQLLTLTLDPLTA